MSYPARTLISEPFVSQIDTIDKTWLEVQNQPSSYFPRRSNRMVASSNVVSGHSNGLLASSTPLYNKYAYYPTQDYYGNYRTGMGSMNTFSGNAVDGLSVNNINNLNMNSMNNLNMNNINNLNMNNMNMNNINGKNVSNVHNLGNLNSGNIRNVNNVSSINNLNNVTNSTLGGMSSVPVIKQLSNSEIVGDRIDTQAHVSPLSAVSQIPEVFSSDSKVFGRISTSPGFMESNPEPFSAFDPFAGESSPGTFFQLSMFNSSSNILGSNLSSTSSNIWGSSNKTISDAAVWG